VKIKGLFIKIMHQWSIS